DILNNNLKDRAGMFARIGKRHIINLNYVYQIAILRQRLVLSDGENFEYQISVSKDALKKLRDMFVAGIASSN
ncbi:MAG: LytTR family transcriptional regulator DNA-binding domain-containing protein, partial [Muribaculaceae bacterium]|nr:LytTR family transcriptional regulator DNA-binding domain-containing protein [Muribaculaceae bacterium]